VPSTRAVYVPLPAADHASPADGEQPAQEMALFGFLTVQVERPVLSTLMPEGVKRQRPLGYRVRPLGAGYVDLRPLRVDGHRGAADRGVVEARPAPPRRS